MTNMAETYEQLRILLSPKGFAQLPKHELTDKLLTNLYSEEEAKLITACFKGFRETASFETIQEKTGIPEDKLADMLLFYERMVYYIPFTPSSVVMCTRPIWV